MGGGAAGAGAGRPAATAADLWTRPLRPMLAMTAPGPFDDPDYLFEVKWDGYRALAYIDPPAGLRLVGRNGHDLTVQYPELAAIARCAPARSIVDGEIVAFVDGRPAFEALRRRPADPRRAAPVAFIAFDMLYDGGEALLTAGCGERRDRLARRLVPSERLLLSEAVEGRGRALFAAVLAQGLEGVMAKRRDRPYVPGARRDYWLKVRNVRRADCVIAGVTPSPGRRLGALVLAMYRGGDLVYVGRAGTGFDGAEIARLLAVLRPAPRCPLAGGGAAPPRRVARVAVWVVPDRVCEVEHLEWTAGGRLRHPVYRGLRLDKDPRECVLPEPGRSPGCGG